MRQFHKVEQPWLHVAARGLASISRSSSPISSALSRSGVSASVVVFILGLADALHLADVGQPRPLMALLLPADAGSDRGSAGFDASMMPCRPTSCSASFTSSSLNGMAGTALAQMADESASKCDP